MYRNHKFKWPFGILIFLAVLAAASAIVMLLWNWLVPSIIGWGALTYLQSAGILLLCKLLIGGFGRFGCHHGGHCHHPAGFLTIEQRARFHEDVRSMSRDERREYIRKHMENFKCNTPERPDGEK